ncbi:MAG: CDP-alcohol phosphatidyltransferase family protein [Planctomycetota bacterium]|nr:CDP-alcohol phosphatidyltransferase family protein [Planctomycetota bacterium]
MVSMELRDEERTTRLLTAPNVISALRLVGSIALAWLGIAGHERAFLWVFVGLGLTDWIDGKLAVALRQRSTIGPRLDTAADVMLYGAVSLGVVLLRWEFVAAWGWMLAVGLGSYALPLATSMIRFGKPPALHTRAAKTTWLLAAIGAIALFGWDIWWPAIVALVAVTLTNLEAMVMLLVMKEWRRDVWSLYDVWRERRDDSEGDGD